MTNRKTVNKDVVYIDPRFPIPEGLLDFVYDDREFPFDPDVDPASADTEDASTDGFDDGDDELPEVPKSFKVVNQKIRTKDDGSQVVDITVEVEKVKGATKYEFRITNKDTGTSTIV